MVGEDVSYTLATSQDQTLFQAVPARSGAAAEGCGSDSGIVEVGGVCYVVRRLMPIECERLQGFPDGWTDIPYRGKGHPPDTPRYKALGNSMAVPVMAWIGERIDRCEKGTL